MNNVNALIGQSRAKEQLSGVFSNHILGGPIVSPIRPRLIYGPSGTGKSRFIRALLADCAERGVPSVVVDDCDSIVLQSGSKTEDVIGALNASQSGPMVLVLDEAQKVFKGSKSKSAMERDLSQFIFCHGDQVQGRVTGNVIGQEVTADFRNLILVLATNEKNSLETSESRKLGEFPFARRFSLVELTNYSQAEMEEIIPPYFNALGYRIGECAAGMIRRLHRGNMAALVAVANRISERVTDKSTLNQEDVLSACRLTDYLPRGLVRAEGKLLDTLSHGPLSKSLACSVSGLHGKLMDASINHLAKQFRTDKEGNQVYSPLATYSAGRLSLSKFGEKYLAEVKKSGFSLD